MKHRYYACLQIRVIRVDDLCRRCRREGYGTMPRRQVKRDSPRKGKA
jgi:hypothetical protein